MHMIKNDRIEHELLVALSQIACIPLDYGFNGENEREIRFNLQFVVDVNDDGKWSSVSWSTCWCWIDVVCVVACLVYFIFNETTRLSLKSNTLNWLATITVNQYNKSLKFTENGSHLMLKRKIDRSNCSNQKYLISNFQIGRRKQFSVESWSKMCCVWTLDHPLYQQFRTEFERQFPFFIFKVWISNIVSISVNHSDFIWERKNSIESVIKKNRERKT